MHRGALRLGAFLCTSALCSSAFAHGEPPAAYAVITHDAEGPRAVRMNTGVALRRSAQQFQFVCPSAWGDQFVAPLAALADGTIVVGATHGLMLLSPDGTVRAHPDPVAVGHTTDVVRGRLGVFTLRSTATGSEVLAVDAQHARVLWKDTNFLWSMAALDDTLVLLRANGQMLEQLLISATDGAELERQVAPVDKPVDYVFARAAAGAAYALVVFRSATALGTLRMNTFTKLAEGLLSIAGPLKVGEHTLLALDGKLSQLVESQARPLADAHNVLCLDQHEELAYACDPEGLARVSGQALGEPLFRFNWLIAPNLEQVPAGEARFMCNAQWIDLRFDLGLVGIVLPDDGMGDAGVADAAVAEGGVIAAAADAASDDAGVDANAAETDAGGALVAGPQPKDADAGCSMRGSKSRACTDYASVFVCGLALAVAIRRRARFAA